MLTHSTRRWLAGLGVAGAFVAASASPAVAADAPFEIATHDLLVAPGHMDYGWFYAQPNDTESEPKFGRTSVLDIDLSAVAGFATVEPAWGCTCDTAPTKLHCEADIEDGDSPGFDYQVYGKEDAKPGQKGALAISMTSGGKTAKATANITVAVAEGVDLVSDPTVEASGAPGGNALLPGVVRNAGETPVEGAGRPRRPGPVPGPLRRRLLQLQVGRVGFGRLLRVRHEDRAGQVVQALRESADQGDLRGHATGAELPVALDWWTTDDWDLAFKETGSWTTSSPARARSCGWSRATSAARVPQTDLDQMNNFTIGTVRVTGDNHADLATKAVTASGKKGDVVTVAPGFSNLGPAVLEYLGQGTPGIQLEDLPVRVSIPADTTVVEAPFDCVPFTPEKEWDPWNAGWGEPGAKEYACQVLETPSDKDFESLYEFGLRIDKVVPDATGVFTTALTGDPNKSNDTAKIVINPTSTDGGNGGGGGGDDDGDGGSLPITGQSTGLIAGLGALLLAAGVGGYLVAKRRRTRFVA